MKPKLENLLITGGSGYLGEQLIIEAVKKGYTVSSLDINPPQTVLAEVRYIVGNILDTELIRESLAGKDAVIHAVAAVPLAKNNEAFAKVNVLGTKTVLQSAQTAGVSKFVYISSSAVYGAPRISPVTESTQTLPLEPYGKAKLAGEAVCVDAMSSMMDIKIIRPRTILGAGRLGIFGTLYEWINDGASVPYVGEGENVYQFVHVSDLANAILLSLETEGFDVFNIGSPEPKSMKESLNELCELANNGSRTFSIQKTFFKTAIRLAGTLRLLPFAPYHAIMFGESLVFDTAKAESKLKWQPKFSSTEALVESFQNFQKTRPSTEDQIAQSAHTTLPRPGLLRILKWVSKNFISERSNAK